MPTRRDYLQRAGTTLATSGVTGAVVLAGVAAAAHYDAQPEHVSLTYDQSYLEQYRPELVLSSDAREKFLGLYGWVATSPEYDTNVCVYWCSYSHQEGWIGNLDSHYGDHEPLQVEVNSETGDVERVRASVYHWIKGETLASEASLKDGRPHLKVVDPWHQYTAASSAGILPEVEDLTAVYQDWLDDGLEDALHPGSSTNPWSMEARGDWWRREYGVSKNALLVSATKVAGIGEVGSLED